MTFTDDDLKRLKEYAKKREGMLSPVCYVHFSGVQALLARLEAAEKVCNHIKENGFPKSFRDKAYDYMDSWSKAAGR